MPATAFCLDSLRETVRALSQSQPPSRPRRPLSQRQLSVVTSMVRASGNRPKPINALVSNPSETKR